ncbi:MAG: iron ABC transporter permease [Pseudomonadota bacterium]
MPARYKFLLLFFLLAAACLLSLRYGAVAAQWSDLADLFSKEPGPVARAILQFRLPRVLCAIVVGLYLALAGLVFQIVLRNPLADPTIFGVSGGASFAVVLAMNLVIFFSGSGLASGVATDFLPMGMVPPIALLGALCATAAVMALAWQDGLSTMRLVLFGAVVAVILNGFVMALVLSLSEARTELAILWLAGSLYARDMANLLPALPWGIVGIFVILLFARSLSALQFDATTAQALGVRTRLSVPVLIVAAAMLASSAVSVAGPVGFVGLLVPHVARLVFGANLQDRLVGCALIGALLVVSGDLLGRVAAPPLEVPVGIVTSLIGAPVFAVLMRQEFRKGTA